MSHVVPSFWLRKLLSRCELRLDIDPARFREFTAFLCQFWGEAESRRTVELPEEQFNVWLQHAEMLFAGWRSPDAGLGETALFVTGFVGLAGRGSPAALMIALSSIGVDSISVNDPQAIRALLNRRYRAVPEDVGALFVYMLSSLLGWFGRAEEAKALFFADLRLSDLEVRDPKTAAGLLHRRLDRLHPDNACAYLLNLAMICGQVGGHEVGGAIVEAYFRLENGDYTLDRIARRFSPFLSTLSPGGRLQIPLYLAGTLATCGRRFEARVLCVYFFGFQPEDYSDPWTLSVRIKTGLLEVENATMRALSLFTLMSIMGQVTAPAILLDAVAYVLEASPGLWRHPDRLIDDVATLARQIALPGIDHTVVIVFAQQLVLSGRPHEGLRLIAAILFNNPELADRPEEMAEFVARNLPHDHVSTKTIIVSAVANLLDKLGHPEPIFELVRTCFGIRDEDFADESRITEVLRAPREGLLDGEDVPLINLLCKSMLSSPDRQADAGRLINAFLWQVIDLETFPAVRESAASSVCNILINWFRFYGQNEENSLFDRCRRTVRFLRLTLDRRGTRFADRKNFLDQVAELRQQVLESGHYHISRSTSRSEADALRLEIVGWDVELGQRLLFERYRFRKLPAAHHDAPSDHSTSPFTEGWSLYDAPPTAEATYLPTSTGDGNRCGRLGFGTPQSRDEPRWSDLADAPDDAYQMFEQTLAVGITSSQLADKLGAEAIFLRARFTNEGRLIWTAFESDGHELSVLAAGESPPGTEAEIQAAVRWHDGMLETLWKANSGHPDDLHSLLHGCGVLSRSAEETLRLLSGRRGVPVPTSETLRSSAVCLLEKATEIGLEELFAPWIQFTINEGEKSFVARDRRERWEEIVQTLRALCSPILTRRLDAVTDEYLRWIARNVDLYPLIHQLGPTKDLVLEVEGALHAVPMALIPVRCDRVAASRLFEHVRSVRASVSLIINLLRKTEDDKSVPAATAIATLSWFGKDDPARLGVRWLHHGQRVIAERHGIDWFSASDWSDDSSRLIAAAIASRPSFRTLTLCGHGDEESPGVRLRSIVTDGRTETDLWDGEGCDLGRVDWLVSVSCSVGRIRQQPGVPDVIGFSADLLARRTHAALTCRWPVESVQAAAFANAVVDEYLTRAQQTGRSDRAAALTRARTRFLGSASSTWGMVGLNTVAAYELYGAG